MDQASVVGLGGLLLVIIGIYLVRSATERADFDEQVYGTPGWLRPVQLWGRRGLGVACTVIGIAMIGGWAFAKFA